MNSPLRKSPSHTIRDYRRESTNKTVIMILGDGDSARCCRLCGADYNLKFFKDTYIWEGVEEKYDQLLYDYFGVRVLPGDSMICEWCIRALRNAERFRALVHAAFDVTASNSDVTSKDSSSVITLIAHSCQTTNSHQKLPAKSQPQIEKKHDEKTKLQGGRKRTFSDSKSVKKSKWIRPEINYKRINVQCNICRQKYPMVVSNGDIKSFTCSRCKKNGGLQSTVCNKCNIVLAKNMVREHMELHVKADLRGKTRLRYLKKKLSPSPTVILVKQTYPCTKCPVKYNCASHLTSHVKNTLKDNKYLSNVCKKNSMASDVTTAEPLVPKQSQRDEFQLLFHNKKAVHSNSISNRHNAHIS